MLQHIAAITLYNDQQMHNYFTNYHTATCFDSTVSSLDSSQSVPCQVTQVCQMQLLAIHFKLFKYFDLIFLHFKDIKL